MTRKELFGAIRSKASMLCVGLDTDIDRIPEHLRKTEDPIFEFNKAIIDATHDLAIAYKPNTAFYESMGPEGMMSLQRTIEYIPDDIFVIADAKRGDIGNTSKMYARSFFNHYKADAITVAPYMGFDSVEPFMEYKDRWVIILGLTSNEGSRDFQHLKLASGKALFEEVIERSAGYGTVDNTMFVIGATQADYIKQIRALVPDHFFLVPGIGAQGGDLESVCRAGLNSMGGLIINSSRSILYAAKDKDFANASRGQAQKLQVQMQSILEGHSLL